MCSCMHGIVSLKRERECVCWSSSGLWAVQNMTLQHNIPFTNKTQPHKVSFENILGFFSHLEQRCSAVELIKAACE